MPIQEFAIPFQGKIGDARLFVQHREVPGKIVSASVLGVRKTGSFFATARAETVGTRVARVVCAVTGVFGRRFSFEVDTQVVFEGLARRGEGALQRREISFLMREESPAPGLISQEVSGLGDRLIDYLITDIEGPPGARFGLEEIAAGGLRCRGGFIHSEEPVQAQQARVHAVIACESSAH